MKNTFMMKRAASAALAGVLAVSLFSCGSKKQSNEVTGTLEPYYEVEDEVVYTGYIKGSNYKGDIRREEFKPILRTAVCMGLCASAGDADKVMTAAKTFAGSQADDITVDAVLFGGRLFEGGDAEVKAFADFLDRTADDDALTLVAPSGEDFAGVTCDIEETLDLPLDRRVTLNDFGYICAPSGKEGFGLPERSKQLADNVTAVTELYNNFRHAFPVFVFTGSEESEALCELLESTTEVILITADKKPTSEAVKQDSFTHLYAGADDTVYIIESDNEGRTLIRAIDMAGAPRKNDDGSVVEWFIQTAWDADSFTYNK